MVNFLLGNPDTESILILLAPKMQSFYLKLLKPHRKGDKDHELAQITKCQPTFTTRTCKRGEEIYKINVMTAI